MEMEKGKRIETEDGEFPLPEAMIQHIQSFLSGYEAVQTTVLSKSWYNAWLTRPVISIDDREFDTGCRPPSDIFEEFVAKTIQRWHDSGLKIESLRLHKDDFYESTCSAHDLIANAMRCGATDVQLVFRFSSLVLPQEVLGSENLLRLSARNFKLDGNYRVSCSRLKSLTLEKVQVPNGDDLFNNIITCCLLMEELSLTYCEGLAVKGMSMHGLCKLTSIFLSEVVIDSMFLSDLVSRSPCLKELSTFITALAA